MCSLSVGKKKKSYSTSSNGCTPLCRFHPANATLSVQSPTAFMPLPGSLQWCSRQICRIFCMEVRVWYICNKSTSITQPMGGGGVGDESRDEKKRRSDKGQTFFFFLEIAISVQWATVGFVKRIHPPWGPDGEQQGGSRRDQPSLVVWWIFWFKVCFSLYHSHVRVKIKQSSVKGKLSACGRTKHGFTTPAGISLCNSTGPATCPCWASGPVRGHSTQKVLCFQHQNSKQANKPPCRNLAFWFLFCLFVF